MDIVKLRAWWFERQGLGGSLAVKTPSQVLERTGWMRSVGGANPYLGLFSRSGTSRESVDQLVADAEIHELPSARNCTYVVPKSHFAMALRMARGQGEPADMGTAKRHLGVTQAELDTLAAKVLEVLNSGPLDPKEMKEPLGDAVRSLGEAGKKRGMGTTLPMVLGLLQAEGLIRRIPATGRLDSQRYKYAKWDPSPMIGYDKSLEETYSDFARLYFTWIGPSSRASFQGVSGLGVKASEMAIAALGLVPIEEGSDLLAFPEDRDALLAFQVPKEPRYVLVSNLDGLTHLRWGQVQSMVDEADRQRPAFGPKGLESLGLLSDLESHAIFDRGRLVGLWEFDSEKGAVAWTSFVPSNEALLAAIAKVETYGREQLGDIRSFSLDSPESRKPRIELLRSA